MKLRLALGVRHLTQSTSACLAAMTKGDLSAITFGHWQIALVTGLGVALLAIVLSFIKQLDLHQHRWGIAGVAFVGTFVVDAFNHGSHYTFFWGDEALITAAGAAGLSLLLSFTPLDKWLASLEKK